MCKPCRMTEDHIRTAAYNAAHLYGVAYLTRGQVAEAAGCSTGTVSGRVGDMETLRAALVAEAESRGELTAGFVLGALPA
jgi:hypothetical protein